jgi:ArsR family transcriptional regulator
MPRVIATIDCALAAPENLMPATDAERLVVVLKALADPVRIRLLRLVADSPDTTACACHLPAALGISQPTLSHHLKKLVDAGLLVREQRGRWAHYRLGSDALLPVLAYLEACNQPVPQARAVGPRELSGIHP